MATNSGKGGFRISTVPVTSSAPVEPALVEAVEELPLHYGAPLLLALARNPQTVFVCWNIDWRAAFVNNLPADRVVHVKVCGRTIGRMHAVEPFQGHCTIGDLEPGETYGVELGYYAPAEHWNVIVSGHEVMMPLADNANDNSPVEIATIPFHLSFQRLLAFFDTSKPCELGQMLGELEERAAAEHCTRTERAVLRALNLSPEHLVEVNALREALMKTSIQRQSGYVFGSSPGSSWVGTLSSTQDG